MIKAKHWDGGNLQGYWKVTRKVDGVRALWNGQQWLSRANKPLFNIPDPVDGKKDVEIYLGNFRDSFRAVRTKHVLPGTPRVEHHNMYSLIDPIDDRLYVRGVVNPTEEFIKEHLKDALAKGFEGLVLRSIGTWLKVKPIETHDIPITGYGVGEGKHIGRLGFLKTSKGDVGTGFTDAERNELWKRREELVGSVIEVSCMQMTPDGMFRHPVFIRERPDK